MSNMLISWSSYPMVCNLRTSPMSLKLVEFKKNFLSSRQYDYKIYSCFISSRLQLRDFKNTFSSALQSWFRMCELFHGCIPLFGVGMQACQFEMPDKYGAKLSCQLLPIQTQRCVMQGVCS